VRVLVTGSNGMIGRALVTQMQADGEEVLGSVRSNPQEDQVAVGDLHEATDWSPALIGCHAVIHTAALVHQIHSNTTENAAEYFRVNTSGTLNLARQAARDGVKRFVFISSIKAMGESGCFHSDDACFPQDAYGASKREAELGLQRLSSETGLEIVVLRAPLVYGPGVGGNFLRLIQLVERGIPLPFGLVRNARSLIGLRNLVDAIVVCSRHPAAAGKIFLVSDGEPVSTPELIRGIASALNRNAHLLPVPVLLLSAAATLVGKRSVADRLLGSLTAASEPLQRELSWKPLCSLQQGLDETVAWYKRRRVTM
jgi:nucleoside-diphosphate-sugar epimerase